jgi:hypothetical protein
MLGRRSLILRTRATRSHALQVSRVLLRHQQVVDEEFSLPLKAHPPADGSEAAGDRRQDDVALSRGAAAAEEAMRAVGGATVLSTRMERTKLVSFGKLPKRSSLLSLSRTLFSGMKSRWRKFGDSEAVPKWTSPASIIFTSARSSSTRNQAMSPAELFFSCGF